MTTDQIIALLERLVTSGQIVDIALVMVLLETVIVVAVRHRLGGHRALAQHLTHLAAGACLLIALRTALTSGPWYVIAAALSGALLAHGADALVRMTTPRGPDH